jgi:uncharacterized protein
MADHPNLTRLREAYKAFGAGDIQALDDYFAEDIVWHVPGNSIVSGDYKGRDEVYGFFAKLAQETEGTFRLEVHDMLANDEHGVVLVNAVAEKDGKTLNQKVVHVMHIKDGKTTEFWGFSEDSSVAEDFYGRR